MLKYKGYKIAIWILSLVIIIQGGFIFKLLAGKKKTGIIKGFKDRPRIAIVIDDWGYNLNNLYILQQIKYPLTASVLPNLNYSKEVVQELQKNGAEVILHLPMEPNEKVKLENNTIMTTMNEPEILKIIREDLNNLPGIKGISNHMGSKVTESRDVMEIVFKELKRRKIYFLDSLVSNQSVGLNLAKELGLLFAKRDVFLDNQNEYEYIKNQLLKLKKKAQVYGQAIGVGHDRKITLEVLRELMPEIEKEDYRFVFVSELTN